jgi:two-component system NarL family response regulator
MADQPQMESQGSSIIALLAPSEEPFVRAVASTLGRPLTIVRTREELEQRVAEHALMLVGDHQTPHERISTVRRAREHHEECVIAGIADDLQMKVELLEAGAGVVATMEDGPDTFGERISAAMDGGILLDPTEAAAVVARLQHLAHLCVDQGVDVERCGLLTKREREIAALLARRLDNASIARELGIAVGTVKTHVHKILDKLDVDTRTLAGVYWRVFVQKRGERR